MKDVAIKLLRDLADAIDKGETQVIGLDARAIIHPLLGISDPYSSTNLAHRLVIEVVPAVSKKEC
jgi:hypothetical protein